MKYRFKKMGNSYRRRHRSGTFSATRHGSHALERYSLSFSPFCTHKCQPPQRRQTLCSTPPSITLFASVILQMRTLCILLVKYLEKTHVSGYHNHQASFTVHVSPLLSLIYFENNLATVYHCLPWGSCLDCTSRSARILHHLSWRSAPDTHPQSVWCSWDTRTEQFTFLSWQSKHLCPYC